MILEKISLGLLLSSSFGPLSAEAMRRGLNGGFWHVFQTRFGGACGNTFCLVIAYVCLSYLMQNQSIGSILGFLGSVLLVLLGYNNIKSTKKNQGETKASKLALMFSNCLIVGFVLAVANPIGIVYWVGVYTASMMNEAGQIANQSFAPNLFIIVGVLIWAIVFSCLVAFAKKIFNQKVIYWLNIIASLLLIYYGVKMGYTSFSKFMQTLV